MDQSDLHEPLSQPREPVTPQKVVKRRTWLVRLAGVLLISVFCLGIGLSVGKKRALHSLLIWLEEHKASGAVCFSFIYVISTIAILPTAVLAVAAGAIWGMRIGVPVVWLSAIVGESLAFLLGRFLLRRWVKEVAAGWAIWQALEVALREDGWKLVALLRLSPAVPFSVLNYALGTSSLSLQQFFWPSLLGIVPGITMSVWLGTLARDITDVVSGGGSFSSGHRRTQIVLLAVGAVSAVVVLVLGAVYTKRAINRRIANKHLHISESEELPIHTLLENGGVVSDDEAPQAPLQRVQDFWQSGTVLQRPTSQQRLQQL